MVSLGHDVLERQDGMLIGIFFSNMNVAYKFPLIYMVNQTHK